MWTWLGTQDNGDQLPEQLLYQVAVDLLRDLLLDPVVHVRGVAGVELVHHDAFRQLQTVGKHVHLTTSQQDCLVGGPGSKCNQSRACLLFQDVQAASSRRYACRRPKTRLYQPLLGPPGRKTPLATLQPRIEIYSSLNRLL